MERRKVFAEVADAAYIAYVYGLGQSNPIELVMRSYIDQVVHALLENDVEACTDEACRWSVSGHSVSG